MTHETLQDMPDRQRWLKVRRSIGALGYVAAATFGGIAANAVSQSSAEVGNWYQVDVRLDPLTVNQVGIKTSLNPLELIPDNPTIAPGVSVLPHLQPTALDSFRQNGNRLDDFRPTEHEVMASLESLGAQMGLKFVAGGLSAALIYGYLLNSGSGRRPHRRIAAGAAAGLVVASAGMAMSAYTSYDPKEQWSVETEGILAEAYANRDLFSDISKQSNQVSSKIGAILQLVNSIETADDTDTQEGGVKFLLVSDIHGMDIGPILKDAAKQYGATAVIFAGDLLNYGTVSELEAAGIPEGIESIGVPFIIVTGNHDKTSPEDQQVLRRLARIKNVVLLQPDNKNFVTVTVGGVSIGGFNDPRNGFDGQVASEAEEQEKAAKDYINSVPIDTLDIVVAHENIAATPINKAASPNKSLITINGHGHKLGLQNIGDTLNIEVGSATAGGLTNNNRYNPGGKNIREIPDPNLNSLDILTFSSSCIAQQLTRVQYTIDSPRQVLTRTIPLESADSAEVDSRSCDPSMGVIADEYPLSVAPLESLSLSRATPSQSPTPVEMQPSAR